MIPTASGIMPVGNRSVRIILLKVRPWGRNRSPSKQIPDEKERDFEVSSASMGTEHEKRTRDEQEEEALILRRAFPLLERYG